MTRNLSKLHHTLHTDFLKQITRARVRLIF